MPLYDYVCPSGHATEKIGGLSEKVAPCFCGLNAYRSEVNQFTFGEYEPVKETRSDVRSFQEASAEVDYHYTKAEMQEGQKVARPNLYRQAKRDAKAKGII